jgi:transketolase
MDGYKLQAQEARLKVLDLIYRAQTSHIGSNFSCIDILTVLFSKIDLDKDKFVLSAGWKAASLYYFLYKKGRITLEELDSYCQGDSKFIGLAEPIIPEIPFSGGSMGLGFPAAVGFALAKKLKGEEGTVYCLMSDGEMNIGTTWEAALIAAQHCLKNLVVIVDNNGFQAMSRTDKVLPNYFPDLGWYKSNIDGHSFLDIKSEFNRETTKPHVIVAETTKGKGVSFMENNNLFHYKAPNDDEYMRAIAELQNV